MSSRVEGLAQAEVAEADVELTSEIKAVGGAARPHWLTNKVRRLDQTSYGRGADLWNSPWNAGNQGIGKSASLSSRIMHRGTQHREENAPN